MIHNSRCAGRQELWRWTAALAAVLVLAGPVRAPAQEPPRDGTPILRVEVRGLETISESFVRRIIRTRAGQPYLEQQVAEDVRELLRTRKFLAVFASPPTIEDGQVAVVFNVQEKPVIRTVELEGNKNFSNDDLFKELGFASGSVLDRFQIDQGRDALLRKYREAGYYYVQVELDEGALSSEARVVYKIIEGPRVRVRRIEFEGARAFPRLQLRLKVRTPTYLWIFRTGAFDEEQAERDAAELQSFYRGEGFLDARVGYRLDFTDVERTRLTLVFVIEEGPRYVIKDIPLSGNSIFSTAQVLETISLKPGDFMREEALKQDVRKLEDLYGEIGFVETRVLTNYAFLEDEPGVVVLELELVEGPRSRFGRITVRGNTHTKDEVVRRELRFFPDEDYNTVKARDAERRIFETGLFKRATITPLEDVDGYREALVEVEEGENIFFNVGVGVSTDNGVVGSLTIENRNFDLFDWPRNWAEFFRGQALRGDGQRLRFVLEPGTEVTRFRIDFTEPYLFDRPLRYDQSLYFFLRQRESYDEERLGFVPSVGRRFETGPLANWAVEGALRLECVSIDDVNGLAANDIYHERGDHFLTSVKATIARDTTDSRMIPTQGYRVAFSWEQVGALGGEYSFGKPSVSAAWYKTLSTDIFDRKTVFAMRGDMGYVVGDAPMFERYYAGGFGSIRGFDFRGVSPRAGILNDRVGGDFIMLAGAEYSFPLYADNVRGVTFLDMGTAEKDFEITTWRASVGFGVRVNLFFFGPVPFVFDFGFPIARDDADDDQIFNFSVGASF